MDQLLLKIYNIFSNTKPEYNKVNKIEKIFENEVKKNA